MELQNHTQLVSFYLNEGDFKSVGKKLTKFGMADTYEFANQLYKDDFVDLDTNPDTVVKASSSAIGHLISEPEGNYPREDTAFADLPEMRKATVNMFVPNQIYNLALSDTSSAITAGDYVEIGADGKIQKSSSSSDTGAKATESKEANVGGFIDVIITPVGAIKVNSSTTSSSTSGTGA